MTFPFPVAPGFKQFAEQRRESVRTMADMVVTATGELYDLLKDLSEKHNCATLPGGGDSVVEGLRGKMAFIVQNPRGGFRGAQYARFAPKFGVSPS